MIKDRIISETPDKWVVLKLDDGKQTYYKVFGSWAGGYLDGDKWKLNSGIATVEEDEDFYYFIGFSGSCYKCHKKAYGVMTSYSQSILDDITNNAYKMSVTASISLEDTNFMELLNQNNE